MKKILLIYSPFCTPATPPYSITNLKNFLENNLTIKNEINLLDLNLKFHKLKFSEFGKYFSSVKKISKAYENKLDKYLFLSRKCYSKNNKLILNNKKPEMFDNLLDEIKKYSPDIVAFSLVYSSQVFYTYSLIKELKKLGIETIVGGEAVSEALSRKADYYLKNEVELLNHINNKKIPCSKLNVDRVLDFKQYPLEDYFTPKTVIPIKSSSTCYYRKCAFCTHHSNEKYFEYDLEDIRKTIVSSGAEHFFFIDDMISKSRLLEIAEMIAPLHVKWTCQLKPIHLLDKETLQKLKDSGLRIVMWGVESGNQRVLNMMRKGTIVRDIEKVLKDSHDAGIINSLFIMFGFPTETLDEFEDTIKFLRKNKDNVDLVLTSIFGLQKGSYVFKNPEKYYITDVKMTPRTLLDEKITYKCGKGLTSKKAFELRKKYYGVLMGINNCSDKFNFFREHMLVLLT